MSEVLVDVPPRARTSITLVDDHSVFSELADITTATFARDEPPLGQLPAAVWPVIRLVSITGDRLGRLDSHLGEDTAEVSVAYVARVNIDQYKQTARDAQTVKVSHWFDDSDSWAEIASFFLAEQPLWIRTLRNTGGAVTPELAVEFVASLNDSLRGKKWTEISDAVLLTSFEGVAPELVIAFLRATFTWRSRIPAWELKREEARTAFERRGLSSKHLLRGL